MVLQLYDTIAFAIVTLSLLFSSQVTYGNGRFKSIISFGDSYADTGNVLHMSPIDNPPAVGRFPYGETYFHRPTGRFSDGRLIIDFIAQRLGLPFVEPFIGGKRLKFRRGVNFAVGGATALNQSFLKQYGIVNPSNNISLETQLDWFATFCKSRHGGCKKYLGTSLITLGEIGLNDYDYAFEQTTDNMEVMESLVTPIINLISFALQELIKLGARTVMVPGNIPMGCLPYYLSYYQDSYEKELYDPKTGCLKWFNCLSEYHNNILQIELNRIRGLYPHVTIIYGDYYNAAMRLYISPNKFGFTSVLKACCGAGRPYNYNESIPCGSPQANNCDNPSQRVSWDGIHMTEAAYHWIARDLLEAIPLIGSKSTTSNYSAQ